MATVGSGKYTYEVVEDWAKLPAGMAFGTVSAVATDSQDRVYAFQRAEPPVVVFDRQGNYLNSWGQGMFENPHGIFIANDIAYADCFVYQLRTAARAGDMLLTISSSGDSENVVRAVDWASTNGVQTIALTGFDGGRTARAAAINIHVKGNNYGVVEDTHQSIMHVFSQYLRQLRMPESRIAERKF